MKKEKVIVIISGGMDSVSLLYWANQLYDVEALTFDYGSKHNKREQMFAKWHCNKLGIKHRVIKLDLNSMGFKSSLLQNKEKIPEGHYAANNMKSTVVPFRNGIMLSISVGYAESIGARGVLLGSHMGDRAQYPDCSKEFTQAINLASQLGTYKKVKIISPFNDMMKWDILKLGLELGIDYSKSWSCYVGGERPCLKCGTDVERIESFVRNNCKDPLLTEEEWDKGVKYMKKALKEFGEKK